MASSGGRRRKPRQRLPKVPDSVPYPGMSRFPKRDRLTRGQERAARQAQRDRPVGRVGRLVLRLLGGSRRFP
jgi:hypothetical protein